MQRLNIFNPTNSLQASIGSGGTSILWAPGTNVNGIILLTFDFMLNSTVATLCEGGLITSTGVRFLHTRVEAGAILAQHIALKEPLFIPSGIGLDFSNLVSPAPGICFSGAWRVL